MFGELISLRTAPPSPPTDPGPKFPLFLLPSSFIFPSFGRRRDPDTLPLKPPSSSSSSPPRLSRTSPSTIRCATCRSDLAFHSQIVSKGFHGRHGRAYLVSPPTPTTTRTAHHQDKTGAAGKELPNTHLGKQENRHLVTGAHVVADLFCSICQTQLGWKYVNASDHSQKYKIGKFILETARVVIEHSWEDVIYSSPSQSRSRSLSSYITTKKGSKTKKDKGKQKVKHDEVMMEENEDKVLEHEHGQITEENKDKEPSEGVIVFDSDDEDECEDIFAGVWDPEVTAKRRESKVNKRKNERA
ncbi:yippee-like protein [Cladorrhinum sp. PSN259]|nr:yippee-like protein [Cladorrhinum sp. PSN259]